MTGSDTHLWRISYVLIAAVFLLGSLFFLTVGRGLTFDGINRTSGFQPLWLCTLIPLFSAHHGTPETMCRIALVLQFV